mgnify:FL=1
MRRQAAIKLNSGKFSLETLGFVTADDNSVMFEFEVDSDRMTVIACDGYAAVRREGDSAYEFELAADTNNPFLIVTEHGRIPAGITGKKITLKKGPQPGLFVRFLLDIGGNEEEGVLTLKATPQEEM